MSAFGVELMAVSLNDLKNFILHEVFHSGLNYLGYSQ